MPSSSVRGTIIIAAICTICAMHSTAAQSAEQQNTIWSNLFGCANKDNVRTIGDASLGALTSMNTITEQRAQSWADFYLGEGTPLSKKAASYLLSGARSPKSRAFATIVTASSFGLWAYDYYYACPK
jgi:hypothetical protein